MITFKMLDIRASQHDLGLLPEFFSEADPRLAAKQLDEHYQHGGGWRPMSAWEVVKETRVGPAIQYPGDPMLVPLAYATLHQATGLPTEEIFVYNYDIIMIRQGDGSFEVARVD